MSALCADFMPCFTSFTIVLALGGNFKHEVTRYQAYFFEFDLPKAATFCARLNLRFVLLFSLSQYWTKSTKPRFRNVIDGFYLLQVRVKFDIFCLILGVFIYFKSLIQYCFPLGLSRDPIILAIGKIHNSWKALAYSLTHGSNRRDFYRVLFAFFLLLLSRQLQWLYQPKLAHLDFSRWNDDFSHSDDCLSCRLIPFGYKILIFSRAFVCGGICCCNALLPCHL